MVDKNDAQLVAIEIEINRLMLTHRLRFS
jgi:hypothetical protein